MCMQNSAILDSVRATSLVEQLEWCGQPLVHNLHSALVHIRPEVRPPLFDVTSYRNFTPLSMSGWHGIIRDQLRSEDQRNQQRRQHGGAGDVVTAAACHAALADGGGAAFPSLQPWVEKRLPG